jgi:hypothetical protein
VDPHRISIFPSNYKLMTNSICRVLLGNFVFAQFGEKRIIFAEVEETLLCSKEEATEPYPEPDECSPHNHILV